jgi:hypothetical protein
MQGQINPVAYVGTIAPEKINGEDFFNEIMDAVCKAHNVDRDKTISRSRKRELAFARYNFMYEARRLTNATLIKIGEYLGRDHSSVIAGLKAHSNLLMYRDYSIRVVRTDQILRKERVIDKIPEPPRQPVAEDYKPLYESLLDASSSYYQIEKEELRSAIRNLSKNSDEDVAKAAKVVRYIFCDKVGSVALPSKLIGTTSATLGHSKSWFRRELPFRRDLRFDYEQILSMI